MHAPRRSRRRRQGAHQGRDTRARILTTCAAGSASLQRAQGPQPAADGSVKSGGARVQRLPHPAHRRSHVRHSGHELLPHPCAALLWGLSHVSLHYVPSLVWRLMGLRSVEGPLFRRLWGQRHNRPQRGLSSSTPCRPPLSRALSLARLDASLPLLPALSFRAHARNTFRADLPTHAVIGC